MKRCWAEALGDCAGPITGEHVVSRAVFTEDHVTVKGFRWCRDEPRQIGLNSLTVNVLCAHHNNTLTSLDDAAGDAMRVFRESLKTSERNKRLMPWVLPTVKRFRLDAALLERWMLKTSLNIKHGRMLTEGNLDISDVATTVEAELCFGRRPFEGVAGMYVAYSENMKLNLIDKVEIVTLVDSGDLVGVRFELHGFRFVLNLRSTKPIPPLETIPGMDPAWAGAYLSRPFKHARFNHMSWPSHYVDFDWSSAVSLPAHP